jgi:branched-chain amino acid transport system ATP-binding protein
MTTLLSINGLTAAYGDIRVLWDINLSIQLGSTTAVLGRNGAGKTSMLNTIVGLPPKVQSGTVTFEGADVTDESTYKRIRRGIGFVQENKQVFRSRSIEDNLLVGTATMRGGRKSSPERKEALDRAYQQFPMLAGRRSELAGRLSGGQQQMLAIAQALMPGPRLLLLDEPSAGLAPTIVNEVFDHISRLQEQGLTIIVVEQVVEKALSIADRVVLIENGRIQADEPVSAFSDASVIREVYLGATAAS